MDRKLAIDCLQEILDELCDGCYCSLPEGCENKQALVYAIQQLGGIPRLKLLTVNSWEEKAKKEAKENENKE